MSVMAGRGGEVATEKARSVCSLRENLAKTENTALRFLSLPAIFSYQQS